MRVDRVLVLTTDDLERGSFPKKITKSTILKFKPSNFSVTSREFALADRVEFRHGRLVKVFKDRHDIIY